MAFSCQVEIQIFSWEGLRVLAGFDHTFCRRFQWETAATGCANFEAHIIGELLDQSPDLPGNTFAQELLSNVGSVTSQ